MTEFRVVDQLNVEGTQVFVVTASSPEEAARQALGVHLVRSARNSTVRAKVYFCHPGAAPSLVRLYLRAQDRDRLLKEAKS